ncbi:MAG: pilin [Rhodanobacteraceae bacterium]
MQKGFTLIELMIVVAIIAILAAIAIPAYQNYLIRTQVTEGMTLMDGAKIGSQEYFSNRGYLPANNTSAGIPPAASILGKYVTSVTVSGGGAAGTNGIITAAFGANANAAIDGGSLQLTGTPPGGTGNTGTTIIWSCVTQAGTKPVAPKYLPASCR